MATAAGSRVSRVDLESGDVCRDGEIERLPPRLLALLRHLAGQRGKVVSRDELMTAVWGHLEAATDDSVNVAVSALRRHLGDNARSPRVIETIPRVGYRYTGLGVEEADLSHLHSADPVAQSEREAPAPGTPGPSSTATDQTAAAPQRWWLVMATAALLLLFGLGLSQRWPMVTDQTASIDQPPANPAVAVLPFLDLGPNAEQSYLADALVDRIIHVLAQAPDLQVAARTSSFAYRDRQMPIEQIGRELGVSAVLEGSVLYQDGQMRVLAQLIDADNGKHLWSRSYDRSSEALFEVQDEIANEVARTMTDTLLPDAALQRPVSRAAYDLVSRGNRRYDEATVASVNEALSLYRQALEHDPGYVDALVGIYEATGLALALGSKLDAQARESGLAALAKAVELAPDDPAVMRARAADQRRQGDIEQALTLYRLALVANPNDSVAWAQLGDLLLHLTRYDEGLDALRRAERIDPLSLRIGARLADAYWSVGRAEEALATLRDHLQREPAPMLHDRMATYLNQQGHTGEAMRHIEAARALDPDSGLRWFRVCEFHLQLADVEGAERCAQAFAQAHDMPFREVYLEQIVLGFRGQWDERRALMAELLEGAHPADPLTPALVAMAWAETDCERALDLLRNRFAPMFEQPPELSPVMSLPARTAIHCLQQQASPAAEPLLQAYLEMIERLRLQQGPWTITGDETAAGLGLAGNHEAALAELQRLVASGWRYYWWGLEIRPEYAAIRDRPEFAALQAQLREGVRREYEYWQSHRDEPLLQ